MVVLLTGGNPVLCYWNSYIAAQVNTIVTRSLGRGTVAVLTQLGVVTLHGVLAARGQARRAVTYCIWRRKSLLEWAGVEPELARWTMDDRRVVYSS
ncbi:hypothetical protein J6590_052603 [Homalodisca vitripennis]|nr:hypothetical protein J6590_052603 [Homalodisca vitripennis]